MSPTDAGGVSESKFTPFDSIAIIVARVSDRSH